jgi:hypothetical protein
MNSQPRLLGFLSLSEDKRIELTETTIANGKTLIERWVALDINEANPWSQRASLAAEFIGNPDGVVDMGAGTMNLERYIPTSTSYYPVDVVQRDARTLVCDFNIEQAPRLPVSTVACLGLLEYLFDVPKFLCELVEHYTVCVVTYCVTDAPEPLTPRRAYSWVNDYDKNGIENIFKSSGWLVEKCTSVDPVQFIWKLRAQNVGTGG